MGGREEAGRDEGIEGVSEGRTEGETEGRRDRRMEGRREEGTEGRREEQGRGREGDGSKTRIYIQIPRCHTDPQGRDPVALGGALRLRCQAPHHLRDARRGEPVRKQPVE